MNYNKLEKMEKGELTIPLAQKFQLFGSLIIYFEQHQLSNMKKKIILVKF
jgi:hypothetical protein